MAGPKRKIYGFLSQSAEAINISLPWVEDDNDAMFKMNTSKVEAVKDDLRAWAKTNWGERVNRFRFGLDARRYVFSPPDIIKQSLIENTQRQIPAYFPFLEIENLEVLTFQDDPDNISEHEVRYRLVVSLKENGEQIEINESVG